MDRIQDKKVLITGAASGIGRATSIRLAARGAEIAAVDIDKAKLDVLVDEINKTGGRCVGIPADLADEQGVEFAANECIRKLSALDILVNNAGVGFHYPTHEMTAEQRDKILRVNLHAPFSLFQHLIHHLMNSECGQLVNISSVFGLVPHQRTSAYCASKYGLVGFSESIRAEYARWGLSVTLVCPGFVDTPLINELPDCSETGQKLKKPNRWITTSPEKVAKKIVKGIERRKRLVLITPLAHFLFHSKRLFPGLFDFVQTFKSSSLTGWFRRSGNAKRSETAGKTNAKPEATPAASSESVRKVA